MLRNLWSNEQKKIIKETFNSDISLKEILERVNKAGLYKNMQALWNIRHRVRRNGMDVLSPKENFNLTDGSSSKSKWVEDETTAAGTIISKVKPKNIEEAAKLLGADLNVWKPVGMKIVTKSWDVHMRDKDGPVKKTNEYYATSVSFKIIEKDLKSPEEIAKIFEELIKDFKLPKFVGIKTIKKSTADHLLEICSFDLHLRKLGWHEEVGENYDVKIACERFEQTNEDLLSKIRPYEFRINKILYPCGNDFFHTDTWQDTTAKGTRVDSDVRWKKGFKIGLKLITDQVNLMRNIAPVHIVIICGNHDYMSMWYAGVCLENYYKDCSDVTIDNNPAIRKYFSWKNVLIGYDHGSTIRGTLLKKAQKYFTLMANRNGGKPWAKSKWREMHIAHFHHEKLIDHDGLICRWLKALCGDEVWDDENAYKHTIRGSQAFLFHESNGLTGQFHSYI